MLADLWGLISHMPFVVMPVNLTQGTHPVPQSLTIRDAGK
jgi:hypothetical protein